MREDGSLDALQYALFTLAEHHGDVESHYVLAVKIKTGIEPLTRLPELKERVSQQINLYAHGLPTFLRDQIVFYQLLSLPAEYGNPLKPEEVNKLKGQLKALIMRSVEPADEFSVDDLFKESLTGASRTPSQEMKKVMGLFRQEKNGADAMALLTEMLLPMLVDDSSSSRAETIRSLTPMAVESLKGLLAAG
jgi:hypothetical protein